AMLRGRERNHGQRTNADFAKPLEKIGKTLVLFGVADDKRLLRLPDPAGRMAFHGRFAARLDWRGQARFENVQAHHVAHRVVKDKSEEIKINDAVETL